MLDEAIKVLRFMHGYGEKLAEDIAAKDFCKQPEQGMNHPAWIFGHLAYAADRHATFISGEQLLAAWKDLFGKGTVPAADVESYPPKDELLSAWRGAVDRQIAVVEAASPEALARPNEYLRPETFPTVSDFMTFSMTAHTSIHLGQLSAWRRADGRPPVS